MKTRAHVLVLVGALALASSGCQSAEPTAVDTADPSQPIAPKLGAPRTINLHAGATVGQWAEYVTGTGQPAWWWGVTGTRGDLLVVELRAFMPQGATFVEAYACEADGRVVEAFRGPFNPDGGTTPAQRVAPDHEPDSLDDLVALDEGRVTLKAAGRDWECSVKEGKAGQRRGKAWVSEAGWFGGLIKSESPGGVIKLNAIGTDAQPGLLLPD
jgi:hypothetical protein